MVNRGTVRPLWQSRLTDEEYRQLAILIGEQAGICLGIGVREYITRGVWRQMAVLEVTRFSEYIRRIKDDAHGTMIGELCENLNCARQQGGVVTRPASLVATLQC